MLSNTSPQAQSESSSDEDIELQFSPIISSYYGDFERTESLPYLYFWNSKERPYGRFYAQAQEQAMKSVGRARRYKYLREKTFSAKINAKFNFITLFIEDNPRFIASLFTTLAACIVFGLIIFQPWSEGNYKKVYNDRYNTNIGLGPDYAEKYAEDIARTYNNRDAGNAFNYGITLLCFVLALLYVWQLRPNRVYDKLDDISERDYPDLRLFDEMVARDLFGMEYVIYEGRKYLLVRQELPHLVKTASQARTMANNNVNQDDPLAVVIDNMNALGVEMQAAHVPIRITEHFASMLGALEDVSMQSMASIQVRNRAIGQALARFGLATRELNVQENTIPVAMRGLLAGFMHSENNNLFDFVTSLSESMRAFVVLHGAEQSTDLLTQAAIDTANALADFLNIFYGELEDEEEEILSRPMSQRFGHYISSTLNEGAHAVANSLAALFHSANPRRRNEPDESSPLYSNQV